jgi:hypothetical protein
VSICQISTTRILSHTAASKQQIAPSVTLLGVSEDSRLAFFSANNASSFGNDGLAFIDSAATAGDLFAVNLANRQIELISGQNLASFGQSATYLGNGEGGSVLYSLGNVSGIQTPAGLLSDGNGTGTDVMAARFNLIDLVNKDDTLNSDGSGSRTDNITRKTFFTLKSWATRAYPDLWLIILGGSFVLVVMFMPKGIIGLPAQISGIITRLRRRRQATSPETTPPAASTEP